VAHLNNATACGDSADLMRCGAATEPPTPSLEAMRAGSNWCGSETEVRRKPPPGSPSAPREGLLLWPSASRCCPYSRQWLYPTSVADVTPPIPEGVDRRS
jgi:hypothetical protein